MIWILGCTDGDGSKCKLQPLMANKYAQREFNNNTTDYYFLPLRFFSFASRACNVSRE